MFSVVEWVDENPLQVSAVPTSWLIQVDGKTRSYWPPTHVANKITKKDFQSKVFQSRKASGVCMTFGV